MLVESMGTLVVINAPSTFTAIWAGVKPMLAKETQDKVCIFGSDYVPFLLEHVNEEDLPASLGGKCTCSEFGGCQFSNVGPWMEGRKERRQRWLRGEISRPGLGLEDLKGESEKEGEHPEKEKSKRLSSTPILPHSPTSASANEY